MPSPKQGESKQDFLKRCTGELVESEDREPDQAYAMCNAFWEEARGGRSSLTLSAPLKLKAKEENGGPREFLITAYTGRLIESWWGNLIIDVAGIETKAKFPVLREHTRDRVVGWGKKSWQENNTLFVSGIFAGSTRDGKEVLGLADEGFPWQASIGVFPREIKTIGNKESVEVNGQTIQGPLEIWSRSLVGEVSLVALGADDETAAIALSEEQRNELNRLRISQQRRVKVESFAELKEKYPVLAAQIERERAEAVKGAYDKGFAEGKEKGVAAGRAEGVKVERERVTAIIEAEGDAALTMRHIREGTEASLVFRDFYQAEKQFRADALKEMAESAPQAIPVSGQSREEPRAESFEGKVQELMAGGKPRGQAIREVVRQYPALHEQWASSRRPE